MMRRGSLLRGTDSIRLRLAVLVGTAAVMTVLAVAGLFAGLRASETALERAFSARQRLDILVGLSGRLSDYGLAAIAAAGASNGGGGGLEAAGAAVEAALTSVAAAGGTGSAQAPKLARVSAEFAMLDRQIESARTLADPAARTDRVRGAFNIFAAAAGPQLSAMAEAEQREIAERRAAALDLSHRLQWAAAGGGLLVLCVMVGLHRRITGPLVRRIAEIDGAAAAIGRGDLGVRIARSGRDELGLVVARFNRMAARLARRERAVAEDRAGLERRVAERTADLQEANTRLQAVDEQRRRFFADVSHELRTPLTVILGECDVALRGAPEPPARAAFTTIRGRAVRLHRRVGDLLRVARSVSGEIELDLQPVLVGELMEEALDGFARHAARRNVTLDLARPIPSVTLIGDREWLRQVLEGLIDNAIEHAIGATRVSLMARVEDGSVRLDVVDDGLGIAPEMMPRLFERFARPAGERAGGFGIGLSLARWVIGRHGGTIAVGEAQPSGTVVSVTLPLPAGESDAAVMSAAGLVSPRAAGDDAA